MSASLDEICPSYVKDQRFQIRVSSNQGTPTAGRALELECIYTGAAPQGPVCPLIFEAKGPSALGYVRRDFAAAPSRIVWVPREGGQHQITLRESGHNRWFGVLKLEVAGEALAAT